MIMCSTFQEFVQAAPHHVDVLDSQEVEFRVGVKLLVLITFTLGSIHDGIQLGGNGRDRSVIYLLVIRGVCQGVILGIQCETIQN